MRLESGVMVVVRVSPDFRLELHLDTDEGNAAGLRSGDHVVLSKSDVGAHSVPL